jgi:hypothetical protein
MRIGIVWATSSTMHSMTYEAIFCKFEEDDVPINGWDEIIQEPTKHSRNVLWTEGNILHLFECCSFGICLGILRTKFL